MLREVLRGVCLLTDDFFVNKQDNETEGEQFCFKSTPSIIVWPDDPDAQQANEDDIVNLFKRLIRESTDQVEVASEPDPVMLAHTRAMAAVAAISALTLD